MLGSLCVLVVLFSVHARHSHKELFCTNDFVNNVRCTWNRSSVGPDGDCWISGVKTGWKPKNKRQPELIILWLLRCILILMCQIFICQQEARNLSTQEQELRIPAWQLIGHWQVRARVKPTNRNNSHWSNWSPTTPWVGETGMVDTSDNQGNNRKPRDFQAVQVPTQLFLCQHNNSDFNQLENIDTQFKWLNPLSVSEPFFTAEPCDHISSVEVCEDWDVPSASPSSGFISSLVYFQSYPSANTDTMGVIDNSSSSSSFSNMGYFMSSSSSLLARADPKPPYQDDFHNPNNSNNLKPKLSPCPSHTTCPAYESLKSEPQSPDSSFGNRKKDEKEDERDMGIDGEQVLDDHNSHFLILPLHLPSQICPPPFSPILSHPASVVQISHDSQQVDASVTAAGVTSAQLMAGAICRSSSMPVEPSKNGYLTLKELQTTFSNKSI
uniref:Interleukin-2 receptor subunit beta N-terminal domain-containing protein n=1 Tax=Amphiprion ocellaris TaxID=80972 RepID=A0AAQ5ZLF0_AMPOC